MTNKITQTEIHKLGTAGIRADEQQSYLKAENSETRVLVLFGMFSFRIWDFELDARRRELEASASLARGSESKWEFNGLRGLGSAVGLLFCLAKTPAATPHHPQPNNHKPESKT